MEEVLKFVQSIFPDVIFYAAVILLLIIGIIKCRLPLTSNSATLRHCARSIRENAAAKLQRPIWMEPLFLGKRLEEPWRAFLQAMELSRTRGITCDVADYINEETVINQNGNSMLAELIPGMCTSVGILGTFVGLSIGLKGIDVMEITSLTQLTSGIALAFNTSIVGIIASLVFNSLIRSANTRAKKTTEHFVECFYTYAMERPADPQTQLLVYQKDQAVAAARLSDEISVGLAREIHDAVVDSFQPLQKTLDDFIRVSTRAQIEGIDAVINKFLDGMDTALGGRFRELEDILQSVAEGGTRVLDTLQNTADSVARMSEHILEADQASEQVINRYQEFVEKIEDVFRKSAESQQDTDNLLAEINESASRQSKYLSALQEYQMKLQSGFQEYTMWTDRFVSGMEERTNMQNNALEHVAHEMRGSSELLSDSYKSFVESIEVGLVNALGLFDDNMQTLTKQVHKTLGEIQETMVSLERSLHDASDSGRSSDEVR